MRVKYFYPWGYSYPVIYGSDRVAGNHLEYFRARGWTVDFITPDHEVKRQWADEFRAHYPWLNAVHIVPFYRCASQLRDMLYAYDHIAESPQLRQALTGPADLFFTNYAFTAPLLAHVPPSCRRVMESCDILTRQFDMAERLWSGVDEVAPAPLADARNRFLLGLELELYRLFDVVVMISQDERRFVEARGITNALYVPQMCEPSLARKHSSPAREPEFDLIFVGSDVIPNVRGMQWFYRNIYVPYLWRQKVRLAIVGGVCSHLDMQDAYVKRFAWVQGPLDDLYESAKLTIVPIFEGTGLPIKTLEGLAMGRAMVVSPVGARGLDDAAGAYVKLDMKADPRRTAEVILELLRDSGKRKKLERAAAEYVSRCFSREAYFGAMDEVVAAAGLNPRPAGSAGVRTMHAHDGNAVPQASPGPQASRREVA